MFRNIYTKHLSTTSRLVLKKNQTNFYGKELITKLEKGDVIKYKNKYVQILGMKSQKIARGNLIKLF